jgi:hypothetical protein
MIMKKSKVKIRKFNDKLSELRVNGDGFELGYIDDVNAYLSIKLDKTVEDLGCCSLLDMQKRLKQLSKELSKDINKIKHIVKEIDKIKKSEQYKKIKIKNK